MSKQDRERYKMRARIGAYSGRNNRGAAANDCIS